MMLEKGTIVRGNWSTIEYRVDHAGKGLGGGWLNCKSVTNPLQSGHFNYLGERIGNEVLMRPPHGSDDRLLIIKEPKQVVQANQMKLTLEY